MFKIITDNYFYLICNLYFLFKELQRSMARQQDEETLKQMKKSWESKLPDQNTYNNHILPILRNAALANSKYL